MTEHTPGPWRASNGGAVYADDWQVAVASRPENYAADARLIAAAPELLAACRQAATLLWHARTGPDDPVRAALDAAIAKATG